MQPRTKGFRVEFAHVTVGVFGLSSPNQSLPNQSADLDPEHFDCSELVQWATPL